jgi:hypothetical protein
LQDILYARALAKYGYVKGVGAATMSNPRNTFQNDPYFTDGNRVVMWVSSSPVSFSELQFLKWEIEGLSTRRLIENEKSE